MYTRLTGRGDAFLHREWRAGDLLGANTPGPRVAMPMASDLGKLCRRACLLLSLLCPLPSVGANVEAVYADFSNQIKLPPGVNPPVGAATFFGGHVKSLPVTGGTPTIPSGGGYRLTESSFGQLAGFTVPYPNFEQVAVEHALKTLYYDKANDTPGYEKAKAAFSYKTLLYSRTAAGITPGFSTMASLWNSTTRARARAAADGIAATLRYSPGDQGLRNALLDVLYDIAIAEVSLAKELETESLKASMSFPGYLPPFGEFAISPEIDDLRRALDGYYAAAQPYFDLLTDRMGVGTRVGGGGFNGIAFGYYLFREQQPGRSLYASTFREADGTLKPVLDQNNDGQPDRLFVGYKDLVLLFEIERDSARVAAKLAKLLALRGDDGDLDEANAVVGAAQQRGYTDGEILNGMFSEAVLSAADRYSGLKEARAGWAQGLTSLSGIKSFLDGKANPLGLDPDFLALVQNDSGDSYGYFEGLFLGKGTDATLSGALGDAFSKYQQALTSYTTFRQYQDKIGAELLSERGQFADRLRAIVGCPYPDPPSATSCYYTPNLNSGGEIYLQLQNIDLARLRISKNQQEIANLRQQVENEIERRGKEHGINDLMAQTYIRYGDKQAKLTEEIAKICAEQAAANGVAAAAASTGLTNWGWGGAAQLINAAVQSALEIKKGQLGAQKERLSAQQGADITYLNDQISAANSEALVKNLLLGMSTLSIESTEASILLAQDLGRLQALLDEKAYLEGQWAEAEQDLGSRYFADPSHRIIQNRDILSAGQAFDKAQLWVFIMARALEYKWNHKVFTDDGYSADTVFKLRNADELSEMAKSLWDYDKMQFIGSRHGDQFVRFSFREDFLGYRRTDFLGHILYYPDPVTGQSVDALTAFHSYLKKVAAHVKPTWGTNKEVVRLQFSTVKPNIQGTFFSPDRWNEKINWVAVSINAESPLSDLQVLLEQSGTAFIRNEWRGEVLNPARPDLLTGEMAAYPVRYWYQTTNPVTGGLAFRSKDTFSIPVNAAIARDPAAPEESWRKKEFHELSPAVSTWTLEVPTIHSSNQPILDLDKVSDIEIWFYNYYLVRN